MPQTRTIHIAYDPFPLSQAIHHDPARFRMLCCGRRFGKSWMAVMEAFQILCDTAQKNLGYRPRGLIVAPTYKIVREDWLIAKELLKEAIVSVSESDMVINFGSIGDLDFRSADSQGGVGRGGGYDVIVVDEATFVPEGVWESDLRPTLSDRRGRALFISTPTLGRNWFYRLWLMGKEHPDYKSWHYATIEGWRSRFAQSPNRLAQAEEEWEQIQRTTSDRTFRKEWLAEFLESEGQLWSLSKCLRGALRPPLPRRHYVAGLDVARVEDWMVTAILEVESCQLVGLFRSRHRAWDLQKADALWMLRQYPQVHVLVDATGVGDPIAQDLQKSGLSIEPIRFTSVNKKQMVENLGVAVDQGLLGIPDAPQTQWLLEEMRSFREWETASGHIRYGAPEGMHDDGVTALMLALWGMRFEMGMDRLEEAAPRPSGVFLAQELIDYTNRIRQFTRRFPEREPPRHPWALAWREHARWMRWH